MSKSTNLEDLESQQYPDPIPLTRKFLFNIPGKREVHAVDTIQNGMALAAKFKREGRQLTYRGATVNPNPSTPKDPLRWICVWDGPDACEDHFEDYRYNRIEEYSTDLTSDEDTAEPIEEFPPPPLPPSTHMQLPSPRSRYKGNAKHRHFRQSRRKDWQSW